VLCANPGNMERKRGRIEAGVGGKGIGSRRRKL
jgi:hypothetical protein